MLVKIKQGKYLNTDHIISLEQEYGYVKITATNEVVKIEFETEDEATAFMLTLKKKSEILIKAMDNIAKMVGSVRSFL